MRQAHFRMSHVHKKSATEQNRPITQPMYYARNSHTNYAFAIGSPDAATTLMLPLITAASKSDSNRPSLKVKNSWSGYLYSLDGGATWIDWGYDIKL